MIPLRIAFDMDGTLADLSSAYAEIEEGLFGPELAEHERPAPELREAEQHGGEDASAAATIGDNRRVVRRRSRRGGTRHRDGVWRAIEGTPNFWTTLKPLENGAITRLYQLTGAAWIDPVAGFIIAIFAIHEGREAWHGELVDEE